MERAIGININKDKGDVGYRYFRLINPGRVIKNIFGQVDSLKKEPIHNQSGPNQSTFGTL